MKTPSLRFGLLSAIALAMLSGCSGDRSAGRRPPCCPPPTEHPTVTAAVSGRSIYQVDSMWTTDEGRSLKLSSLQGRTQVVVMFFVNCQAACPLLVHDMKRIEQALPADVRDRVGFALVTFDPDRDTVESLHAYRSRNHLDPQHWTLLRGKPDDIQELAVLLGIKYKKDAQGQFAHSNLITVLNRAGEIVHQQFGLAQAPDASLLAIQRSDEGK